MEMGAGFGLGLGSLPLLASGKTRSISAENPTGEAGGGAKVDPEGQGPARRLGKGWKARPCLTVKAGETATLAEIEGPGVVQHIWMTSEARFYRDLVLRFYWDGEKDPSIEVPMGDFFACGHAEATRVNSLPVAVNPRGALNSYWPMPFRKSARITVENPRDDDVASFFYQINYSLTEVPVSAAYLHAQWRRAVTQRENPDYIILDGVRGRGHYVGTYLAWTALSNGWWGEGEIKFYLDGDKEHPTICGTGTEDYFGGAWGFHDPKNGSEVYSTPFLGLPLVVHDPTQVRKYGMYRWHILDPIRFEQELRVTIQALGWGADGTYLPLDDDIASVALWYQTEPHRQFPVLLPMERRWPR